MNGILHKLNLLSPEEFQQIVEYKENIVNKGKGAITINEHGEYSINTDASSVFIGSIFNYQYTIEGFEPYLGRPFVNIFNIIQDYLKENGIVNPRPYMARCYRNNQKTPWHRHQLLSGHSPKQHWIVLYYMHPNWDTTYGGALGIGLMENEHVYEAQCLSNSLVAHNGYYGHGVEKLTLGYEGDRDLFLTHWLTD